MLEKWNEKLVAQSGLALCDPMDCSLLGFFVHRILQARILGWVAISFSRASSRLGDQIWVSCIADRFFTSWATNANLNMFQSGSSSHSFLLFGLTLYFSIPFLHQFLSSSFLAIFSFIHFLLSFKVCFLPFFPFKISWLAYSINKSSVVAILESREGPIYT